MAKTLQIPVLFGKISNIEKNEQKKSIKGAANIILVGNRTQETWKFTSYFFGNKTGFFNDYKNTNSKHSSKPTNPTCNSPIIIFYDFSVFEKIKCTDLCFRNNSLLLNFYVYLNIFGITDLSLHKFNERWSWTAQISIETIDLYFIENNDLDFHQNVASPFQINLKFSFEIFFYGDLD